MSRSEDLAAAFERTSAELVAFLRGLDEGRWLTPGVSSPILQVGGEDEHRHPHRHLTSIQATFDPPHEIRTPPPHPGKSAPLHRDFPGTPGPRFRGDPGEPAAPPN